MLGLGVRADMMGSMVGVYVQVTSDPMSLDVEPGKQRKGKSSSVSPPVQGEMIPPQRALWELGLELLA